MPTVADLVSEETLWELAEERAYHEGYGLAPVVQLIRFAPLVVTAEIGTSALYVELTVTGGELRWFCTCPAGRAGLFCSHCVATALIACRRAPATS
ncbi:SWIM zinc finger family protein [Bailinhaonella thermotolerans]|uniref:SWIM zinc finger family protein n=1 Tax=Bailinhaonella thermotolerans TaxID=1070861 RepID=UPI00192A21A4|nr:SWIM zinc finger family protein [Bailinhaonella thermotolerans]